MKDVTLKAPEVDLALDWQGKLQKVFIPGYDLSLHGAATDLAARFATWSKEPHGAVACEAKAGHLTWTDAIVPGVQIEGIDVSLTVGDASERAVHAEIPSLTVTALRGALARGAASSTRPPRRRSSLSPLDRAKPRRPAERFARQSGRPPFGSVLSITIPRTKPAAVAASRSDFVPSDLELLLESQVLPTGELLTAHAKLTLFGVPNAAPGVTVPTVTK